MNLFDMLHDLVDHARFHSEQQALDAHDAISAHEQGFKSVEEYRESMKPPPSADDEEQARIKYEEIVKRRKAQDALRQEQQAGIPQPVAERPAPPKPLTPTETPPAVSEPEPAPVPAPPAESPPPARAVPPAESAPPSRTPPAL